MSYIPVDQFKEKFPAFIPENQEKEVKECVFDICKNNSFFENLKERKQKDIAIRAFEIAIAYTIFHLNQLNYSHRAEVISTEQELVKIRQTIQDLVKFAKL